MACSQPNSHCSIADSHRTVALTPDGKRLAAATGKAFAELAREGTPAVGKAGQRLRLKVLPMFGSAWLMPRLATFITRHPEIELALENVDFDLEEFDAGISVGDGSFERRALRSSPRSLRAIARPLKRNQHSLSMWIRLTSSMERTALGLGYVKKLEDNQPAVGKSLDYGRLPGSHDKCSVDIAVGGLRVYKELEFGRLLSPTLELAEMCPSALGQTRKSWPIQARSGIPPTADIQTIARHGR